MILIRADANKNIGVGHVMRCLSIANALKVIGEEVVFVTADNSADNIIDRAGFEHVVLNSEWNDFNKELGRIDKVIDRYCPNTMLIDSYYINKKYFTNIREKCKVAYVDDINEMCWPLDYLINYNIYSSVYDYSLYENTDTKLLLGTEYTPLREEYHFLNISSIPQRAKNILISAGGSDPENITMKILSNTVCNKELRNCKFHFVIGALNPKINEIKTFAKKSSNVELHINESRMSKLMCECDIAISASGTTLYELCSCGVPTITYTLADNQLIAASQFEKLGIMLNAGDCRNNDSFIYNLEQLLIGLVTDHERRSVMSKKMREIVDGKGANRIAQEIIR